MRIRLMDIRLMNIRLMDLTHGFRQHPQRLSNGIVIPACNHCP
jgi:hypothetical protein